MKNVEIMVQGNTLIITVDLTKFFGPSSSGKSVIVATTAGNIPVPGCTCDNSVPIITCTASIA